MQIGFSVPVHVVDSNLSEEFLLTLKKDIYLVRDNDSGFSISNNHGWHSTSDLFSRKEESFRGVCSNCASSIASIMKSYDENFDPESIDARFAGWINVNPKGGSNMNS